MAVTEGPITGSPQGHSPMAEQLADVLPFTPRESEGLFLPNDDDIYLLDQRTSGGRSEEDPPRTHNLVSVEKDGYRHVMWVTESLHPQRSPLNVISRPGLGEVIEDGVGWQFHKGLARNMPEARVTSVATNGVGRHGAVIPLSHLPMHGINQMAEQEFELLQNHLGDERIVLVGVSMGTVINHRMLLINEVAEDPLNVEGVVNYAPALVDPANVVSDMALKFPYEMMKDGVKEVFTRTRLCHMLGTMMILGKSGMRRRDLIPMARQTIDLLLGTPEDEIEEIASVYPTAVIVGTEDPVGQIDMWARFKEDYEDLHLYPLEGRGHGIAVKPIAGSKKVAHAVMRMGSYPELAKAST